MTYLEKEKVWLFQSCLRSLAKIDVPSAREYLPLLMKAYDDSVEDLTPLDRFENKLFKHANNSSS
jgi:hypothetical protein